MKTSTLLIKSAVLATALILTSAAQAQGYGADQIESPAPYGGSGPREGTSGRNADYGPSETTRRGQYESYQSSNSQYGDSCESSESNRRDLYDRCGYNGTGPRIKSRY
jgi:hypothetical protein